MKALTHNGSPKIGPKPADHPTVGYECPACHGLLEEGQFTTVLFVGPGGDPEARQACLDKKPFTPVALEFHWACVTGELDPVVEKPRIIIPEGLA